jgi:hypothetical protein
MMRNGRAVDHGFLGYHRLYYRCATKEDVEGNHLLPARVRAYDISVNWSKYSKPWDVIFDKPLAGIVLFFVHDIQLDLPIDLSSAAREQDKPKPHLYRPIHEPEDDNYSHSAIAIFKDGERITKERQVGTNAKKEFRQIISDRSLILRHPRQ